VYTARCLYGPCDGEVVTHDQPTLIVFRPKLNTMWSPYGDVPDPIAYVCVDTVRHVYRFQALVLLDGLYYDCWVYAGVIGTPAKKAVVTVKGETQMNMLAKAGFVVRQKEEKDADGKVTVPEVVLFHGNLRRAVAEDTIGIGIEGSLVVGALPTREEILRIPAVYDVTKDVASADLEVLVCEERFRFA